MSRGNEAIGTLTIPSGAAVSPALSSILSQGQMKVLGSMVELAIYSPAALTTAMVVQIAPEYPGVNWKTMQQDGADIVPTAGDVILVRNPVFLDLRIQGAGNEAADRDFTLMGKLDYPDN
jgi:hypothetical protein